MMDYGAAPAVGYFRAPVTEETVIGPPPSAPVDRPSWAPIDCSAPLVVDLAPYVAANCATPAAFHWASPSFAPAGALPRGIDSAAITSVAMVGDLVLDLDSSDRQHLLTSGPPAWLLPAIAGSTFLALMAYALAADIVIAAREALSVAIALAGG